MNRLKGLLSTKTAMFIAGLWIGGFTIAIMMEVGGDHLASQLADMKVLYEEADAYAVKCDAVNNELVTLLELHGYERVSEY